MTLQPEQIQYLTDVLGVSAILIPEGQRPTLASPSPNAKPIIEGLSILFGDLKAPLAVITKQAVRETEKQLALKIAEATGAREFCIVELANWQERPLRDYGIQASYAIVFESDRKSSDPIDHYGARVLVTNDLQEMTMGSPEQIKKIKGQVWSQIQVFKQEWKQK